jgi:hypothetical protein
MVPGFFMNAKKTLYNPRSKPLWLARHKLWESPNIQLDNAGWLNF